MKRFIIFLLVMQIVLLSACTFPFGGKSEDQPSGITDGQDMVKLEDGENDYDEDSDTMTGDSPIGTVNATTSETNTGTIPEDMASTSPSGVSGSAITSSVTSSTSTSDESEGLSAEQITDDFDDSGSGVLAESIQSEPDTEFTEGRYPVTVYYQDGDGYLIPMTRWILFQQGVARAAVSLVIDSAIAREEVAYYGVYPVIPADTEILGIDIKDGIATIDFDRHLLEYKDAASERNIMASIIYTLTEFESIRKVRILVNGYPQSVLKYGTDITEALGRENITINTNEPLLAENQDKVDVFLLKKANEGFTYVAPISVDASDTGSDQAERLVKQLISMDTDDGMFSEVPDGVELLECSTNNGVLTLNFSGSFTEYGGNAKEEGMLKQLAYTARQIKGIRLLKILVEGQKVELPEGTDVSAGLMIPATINDVMDR